MEQQNGDTGGENATLDRVLNFFKELRRNSEWAQLHLETTVTGDLAVNLSVRCPAAVSSSGAGMPRTGGGVASSRTTRISPSRARRNYRRRLEFLDRKNSAEKPEERNVTVEDEALPETTETGSRDIMDLDTVENLEETDDDTSAETRTVIGATAADQDNIVKTGASLEERNKETMVELDVTANQMEKPEVRSVSLWMKSKDIKKEEIIECLKNYDILETDFYFCTRDGYFLGWNGHLEKHVRVYGLTIKDFKKTRPKLERLRNIWDSLWNLEVHRA